MLRSAFGRGCAFILLTAFLAVGLHLLITWSIRRITTGSVGSFNRAMQGRADADIVISGSSRAYRHYDPRVLSNVTGLSCFNLGLDASQIDLELGVLEAYLQHNRKPQLVIQNLDIFSLVLTKPGDIPAPAQYGPYLSYPEIYSCLDHIENGELWKWKYIPLYTYAVRDTSLLWISALGAPIGIGSKEPNYSGFSPEPRLWNDDFARFKHAHPNGIEIEINPEGIRKLEHLVEVCHRERIKVIFVYSPQYYEMIQLTNNRARIFHIFEAIARRHKVPFLDYTDSPICRERTLFYNAQHLNSHGAQIFSEDLARKIKGLLLPDSQSTANEHPQGAVAP